MNALSGLILATIAAGAAVAEDVGYRFEWQGANGYAMQGAMSFDESLLGRAEVYAPDLSCFYIDGTKDGAPLGRWALGLLNEDTSWTLTFLPAQGAFAVFGPRHVMPQAWNMDGFGNDCGIGGFGFNIGNAAQDLCVDGRLVVESQVAADRPFAATRDDTVTFARDACPGPDLLSLRLP